MACPLCEKKQVWRNSYAEMVIGDFGKEKALKVTYSKCPAHAVCSNKETVVTVNVIINYCPNCGEKLKKEEKEIKNG